MPVGRETGHTCLCVFCVGPLCSPPLRWWVLCGILPSVWAPCGWGSPLSCSRTPWHLFLVLPLAARAHALAVHTQTHDKKTPHNTRQKQHHKRTHEEPPLSVMTVLPVRRETGHTWALTRDSFTSRLLCTNQISVCSPRPPALPTLVQFYRTTIGQ